MNVRRFFFVAAAITAVSGLTLICTSNAVGQDPFAGVGDDAMERISPFDAIKKPATRSDVRRSQMSVSELRQARALYRANQRVARLEHNLWMGYEPLRPKWNAVPMMTSRYAPRKYYVPVYVHSR
jgi:hypothetical protein